MKKGTETVVVPVKDGWIVREAGSGRFQEVQKTGGAKIRASSVSISAVETVSGKRSASLRRLADR